MSAEALSTELKGQELLDAVLPAPKPSSRLDKLIASGLRGQELLDAAIPPPWARDWHELRQAFTAEERLRVELHRRGSSREARPGRRSRSSRSSSSSGDDDPEPEPPLGRLLELKTGPA